MNPHATKQPLETRAEDAAALQVVAATRNWLEKAVIGLRLCPFAEAPYLRKQIRFQVSKQRTTSGLVHDLARELRDLHAADPRVCETSLLIHPYVLNDFGDYNQFLNEADATVLALGLEGELQVASFHPAYQFAGSEPNAVENYSNRSPYPMLHLLREASVSRAATTFRDVNEIGNRNVLTMNALGDSGWRALWTSGTAADHDRDDALSGLALPTVAPHDLSDTD